MMSGDRGAGTTGSHHEVLLQGRLARGVWCGMANEQSEVAENVGPHHVAIDLTPILPGGESGGAKLVALALARHLGRVAPGCKFTLLTLGHVHDDLELIEADNVKRLRVVRSTSCSIGFSG